MDIHKIKLLYHTVKYLKPIQVYYRIYYFFKKRIFFLDTFQKPVPIFKLIKWENKLNYPLTYLHKNKSFTFLNITHSFKEKIDWNYDGYGKLWTYNLNYFDFLNQEGMSKNIGIYLINDYIKNYKILKEGKEPYPISLRGINWVKFLIENSIKDTLIEKTLYNDYHTLFNNLEYHLLGNHLLENAFSLLFGAYYFQDKNFYYKTKEILISELKEQILRDGGHFELSPMYHQIILFRVLDCIKLIKFNSWKNDELLSFLEEIGSKMTSWLSQVTFDNGDIPRVNDSTFNIAPTSQELFKYAYNIGVTTKKIVLSDSGYRKFKNNKFELFVDVGNIGPYYQPGHAHSDTLSFILHVNNKPIFVDTGVSTYRKNQKRQTERQTSAHNTVVINNEDQTQVWGGFRVAKRAQVQNLKEGFDFVEAEHDGYKKLGVSHLRKFSIDKSLVKIEDTIVNDSNYNQTAYFHLHPSLKNLIINENSIIIENNITMIFNGTNVVLHKERYDYAEEFNKLKKAIVISATFKSNLETLIKL
tara:strand:- start:8862 stop:10445 length:1584 start_codon:yes stop_codon:yes gene_type:complete